MRNAKSLAFAVALLLSATTASAVITTAVVIPRNPTYSDTFSGENAFGFMEPSIVYARAPGTGLDRPQYDLRDIFGGRVGGYGPEVGRVVFADRAVNTPDVVTVKTRDAFSIKSLQVLLGQDGQFSNWRSATRVRLLADTTVLADVSVIPVNGSYFTTYGSNVVEVQAQIAGAPLSRNYTLEFYNAMGRGVRAMEVSVQAVPEPTALALLGLLAPVIGRRRRC